MEGTRIENPDVIIVGSGAGGATAARFLTQKGYKVVIFEKGPNPTGEDFLPYDELHFKHHEKMSPSQGDDPNIYSGKYGDTDVRRWWIANMVGGATRIWDANFPRYTREDMSLSSLMKERNVSHPEGASIVDWPWTYDEFQPYFEKVEHEWGVSGKTRQSPKQEKYREGYEFPMPPVRMHKSAPFLIEKFNAQGWYPYRGAKAVNSRTYDGRPGYAFSGYFAQFGDPLNDRASAHSTMIPKALATGRCDLRYNHCVTRLLYENGKITGVRYQDKKGELSPEDQKVLKAPIVIVSIQAVQSARLFKISEIPDPHDQVGHYLTYHTKGTVIAKFPNQPVWADPTPDSQYMPRTSIACLEVRDLYWIDDEENKQFFKGGKFSQFDPYTTSTPIDLVSRTGKWGKPLIEELKRFRSHGGAGFSFTGESLPVHSNRVELDETRKDPWGLPLAKTFYKHHAYDLELSKYALGRVAEVLKKSGGTDIKMFPQSEYNSGYGHNHGCLRAGEDQTKSVLDTNCQSWEVKGLYVLDCSFMPTSGASNPSLTLLANAYRVCEKAFPAKNESI